jgi:hypothetical protein
VTKRTAGYAYKSHTPTFVRTEQTGWPRPGAALDSLDHRLRYGAPTKSDLLMAATVLSAYTALCDKPREVREAVIRAMRKADSLDQAKEKESTGS